MDPFGSSTRAGASKLAVAKESHQWGSVVLLLTTFTWSSVTSQNSLEHLESSELPADAAGLETGSGLSSRTKI